MTPKKGFTLIELLVVIAIIGILASIVLVSLSGARNRAKDARITSDMSQLRTVATISNDNYGNYDKICIGAAPCDADLQTLKDDMNAQNATGQTDLTIYPAAPTTSYCAYIQMNTGWWCVDSELRSKRCTAAPTTCVAAGPYTCADTVHCP